MKQIKFLLLIMCLTVSAAQAEKEKGLSTKQLQWYSGQSWMKGIAAKPDPSVDVATFVRHYQKHPERWNLAFKYMRENDLGTLPIGKVVLSDEVSINVQEYTTKDPGQERFEGHRANIDLQYVVSGKELIGLAKVEEAKEVVPYDASSDYAGFQVSPICYHTASPERFFIFFPADIHLPCIQYGEKAPVRKVVFKIKVD
jgi:YhcH/YjgK/YiaL family protein